MRYVSLFLIVTLLAPSAVQAHCEMCPSDENVIVVSEPTSTPGSEAAAALLGLAVVGAVVVWYLAVYHQPRAVIMTNMPYRATYAPPIAYQYQQPYAPSYYGTGRQWQDCQQGAYYGNYGTRGGYANYGYTGTRGGCQNPYYSRH